jgi:hypothetical protein
VDGSFFDAEGRVLRDRYYGPNPVNLLFALDDLLAAPPSSEPLVAISSASFEVSFSYGLLLNLKGIDVGLSGVVTADQYPFVERVNVGSWTHEARLLAKDVKWDPVLRMGQTSSGDIVRYCGDVFNLTCLQRIFSVQRCGVVCPFYDAIIDPPRVIHLRGRRARNFAPKRICGGTEAVVHGV